MPTKDATPPTSEKRKDENTDKNDGTQQQGSEIPRIDTFKGDEAQTSIPAEPKDRRQWIGLP